MGTGERQVKGKRMSIVGPVPVYFLFINGSVSGRVRLSHCNLPIISSVRFIRYAINVNGRMGKFRLIVSMFKDLRYVRSGYQSFLL